ncbi:MAG: glycosyltransferase, partial [Halothiobacillus sp.]|nr:glycosyltransferase [Halothiobacillus sp.]
RLPRSWKSLFSGFFGTVAEDDEGLLTYRFCGMDWFRRLPRLRRWLWLHYGMKLVDRYVSLHGKPDVLHAHAMLNGGVLAKAVSERFAIPFVVTEHCTAFARGLISPQQIGLARGVAASAARRFAVSGAFCKLLERQFAGAELRWEEMPNIVDRKFIDAKLPTRHSPAEPFTFLNVALLTEKKAVHNLVSAFARIFGNDPDVILKIGGDGVERPRLEALAAELGVADRVLLLGMLSRKQVLEEMSNANAFVLSSRYETFGVVVIEALALGKPVIATRCGGPESIVREQDGLLVPTDDVPALAEAMKKMRSGYAGYDAGDIRAACIARYSESPIVERLSSVYLEVHAANDGTGD